MGCNVSGPKHADPPENILRNDTKQLLEIEQDARLNEKSVIAQSRSKANLKSQIQLVDNKWEQNQTNNVISKNMISCNDEPVFNEERDLEILEFLGKGGFGKVYKAWHKRLNKYVALKFFHLKGNPSDEQMRTEVEIECSIMRELEQNSIPNVIHFYSVYEEERQIEGIGSIKSMVLMMESGECSMSDLLKVRKRYAMQQLLGILWNIAVTLEKMEEIGISQGDIKPANFILSGQQYDTFKLSDFGIANELAKGEKIIIQCQPSGTPSYMSPEVFVSYQKRTAVRRLNPFKSDVYSLGLTVCAMMGMDQKMRCQCCAGELQLAAILGQEEILKEYHPITAKLLPRMLAINVKQRASFGEIAEYLEQINLNRVSINEGQFVAKITFDEKIKHLTTEEQARYFEHLGKLYFQKLGRFDKAEEFYAKTLQLKRLLYAKEMHPEIAISLNNLGEVYRCQGKLQKALKFHEDGLAIKLAILGEENASTASSINNIAQVYRALGESQKALEMLELSLRINQKLFGEEHPSIATCYNNIAELKNMTDKSLELHELALSIRKKYYGENHIDTATSLNNIALIYQKIGDNQNAIRIQKQSLKIIKNIFGNEHPFTAIAVNNIGQMYKISGNYEKALNWYKYCLNIRKAIFSGPNAQISTSYNNIAYLLLNQGKNAEALPYFIKTLEIEKQLVGSMHENVVTLYYNLGALYQSLDNEQKARDYFQKYEKIQSKLKSQANSSNQLNQTITKA